MATCTINSGYPWSWYMSEKEDPKRDSQMRGYTAHLVNTAITVFLSVMAVNNDVIGNRNEQLRIAYERIAVLERENAEIRGTTLDQVALMARLQYKLDNDFEPLTYLRDYMDSIGIPAWIKVYDPGSDTFTMLAVNDAYSIVYAVPGRQYSGVTDYFVWPEHLAAEFEKNDREVIAHRRRQLYQEHVILARDPSKVVTRSIWKHYFKLPDGREAVAGIDIGAAGG